MTAPYVDLIHAAARARAAATHARQARELNPMTQRIRDRLTAAACALDHEADFIDELLAEARKEAGK